MSTTKTSGPTVIPDKMPWRIKDQVFADGSTPEHWKKVEGSPWIPQGHGYELNFDIYEHAGYYWKLYSARWKREGGSDYTYSYGGVACRMAQVEYTASTISPHSGVPKKAGEVEWVRVEEVDTRIHTVLRENVEEKSYENRHDGAACT